MTALLVAVAPSTLLAVKISLSHVAAAILLWLVPLPVLVQLPLTLAIGASVVYLIATYALLRTPHAIVALELRNDAVFIKNRDGVWLEGEVLDSSYISPRVTIVNFRPYGRWRLRHVVLTPNNVHPDDFRKLRTWLRWKRG